MSECLKCCENGERDPRNVMKQSFENIVKDNLSKGSSTVCIASIDKMANKLSVCNFGDSQLLVIRNSEIILETKQQQDGDTPYQFCVFSSANQYLQSEMYNLNLESGDIILLFTDGVCDNLFPSEILEICKGVDSSYEIAC